MSIAPALTADERPPRFEERGPTASTCFATTCTDDEHLRDVRHPQRGWVTACPTHGWAVRQLFDNDQDATEQAEPRARVARSGARDTLNDTQGGRATPTDAERESRDGASKTGVAHERPSCHAKGGRNLPPGGRAEDAEARSTGASGRNSCPTAGLGLPVTVGRSHDPAEESSRLSINRQPAAAGSTGGGG